MKTTTNQHGDTIKYHINHCYAHVHNLILCHKELRLLSLYHPQCCARGNACPKVFTNPMLCQRERRPKGLYETVPNENTSPKVFDTIANGNTGPKVFNTSVQILILASVQIVCNIVYVQVQGQIHKELRCEI